jgi:hypothetical protein
LVEEERTSRSSGSLRALVASLWNGMRDLSPPQQMATARIAIALVGDEVIGAGPWSPISAGAWDPNAVQDRLELRTVMALSWADHNSERSPAAVTGEMELRGQPATAASKPFV